MSLENDAKGSGYNLGLEGDRRQHLDPRWSIGALVSVILAAASLLSVVIGLIWGYSRITYSVEMIPAIRADMSQLRERVQANTTGLAVTKNDEANTAARFGDILTQLVQMNSKLDRVEQEKQDKSSGRTQ